MKIKKILNKPGNILKFTLKSYFDFYYPLELSVIYINSKISKIPAHIRLLLMDPYEAYSLFNYVTKKLFTLQKS